MNDWKERIKHFLVNWNELLTIPIGLVLWYYSPALLRMMDPTAAMFDTGLFQIFLFAVIGTLIFSGVNWLIIKINFPRVYHYIDNQFEEDLWLLPKVSRVYVAVVFYFAHFLVLAILALAV